MRNLPTVSRCFIPKIDKTTARFGHSILLFLQNIHTMKRFIFSLLMVFAAAMTAWAQSSKTLVKSVSLDGNTHVIAALPGAVSVSKWDSDFMRITVVVEVANSTEDILKRLVEVGRYEIQVTEQNGSLLLNMPKIQTPVSIKGTALVEKIRYEISAPQKVHVDVRNQDGSVMGSL